MDLLKPQVIKFNQDLKTHVKHFQPNSKMYFLLKPKKKENANVPLNVLGFGRSMEKANSWLVKHFNGDVPLSALRFQRASKLALRFKEVLGKNASST